MKRRPIIKQYKKIFKNEFKGYNVSRFIKDVLAGLTVAAVALPLAIAFGQASVPSNPTFGVVAGMITAIVAGIVMGALGGGSFQISGPTGAMTVVLGGIIAKFDVQGMFLACFMAGIILLVAGLLQFGKLIQFIPRPVIVGFTSGIALVIAFGQFGNLFGVALSGETTVDKLVNLFSKQLPSLTGESLTTMWVSIICSVLTLALILVYPKKWDKVVPSSLVALIVVTVVTSTVSAFVPNLADNIKTIGTIKGTLINSEVLNFSKVDGAMLAELMPTAFTIAALGMIESLLCGVCAAKMKGEKFDSNTELIAQGVGNILVPFMGGVPATAAIARTSVAVKSGGQTRVTSIMQSVFLIICVFALPKVIAMIPLSALVGILFVTAWKMNDFKSIKNYVKYKMWDAIALFVVTMVATVLLDLTYAILIGVVFSFVMLVANTKIDIRCSAITKNGENVATDVVVYSTGSMFFANATDLEKTVNKLLNEHDHFVFAFCGVNYLDVSSVETLEDIVNKIRSNGKTCCFTGVKERVYTKLEKSGFVEFMGVENFYPSLDKYLMLNMEAVEA